MEQTKVMFTRAVTLEPVRKGIYKDITRDTTSFVLKVAEPKEQEEELGLVFGFANVTVQEDGTLPFDWQGDMIKTTDLEMAAYSYVLNKGLANEEHMPDTDCGFLVESMMFTKEKMAALNIPEGTIPEGWWVGFWVPNKEVYAKVKNGTYNMFSIEGAATRVPVEDTK